MTLTDWSGITRVNQASSVGQAAVAYAAGLGLPLFPVRWLVQNGDGGLACSCPDGERCDRPGKHPLIRWREGASRDPADVREMWTEWPHANVALPTGSTSGYVVLDLDVRETDHETWLNGVQGFDQWLDQNLGPGWDVNALGALQQRTGGGGLQLVFADPGGIRTITGWLPGVDVRGEAGYVLLPPSAHRSGNRYQWLNDLAPPPPPELLTSQLRVARGQPGGGGPSDQTGGYDYQAAKRDGPPPGYRDHFFNAYAYELKKAGTPEGEAREHVRRVWQLTDQPDSDRYEIETALDKVSRVYADSGVEAEPRDPVGEVAQSWAAEQTERARAESGGAPPGGAGGDDGGNVTQLRASEPPAAPELASDLGNARRMARVLAGLLIYVHGLGWFIWDDTRWRLDDSGLVLHLFERVIDDIRAQAEREGGDAGQRWARWALTSESNTRIKAALDLAQSQRAFARTPDQLDAHPHLLCCPNGVLDLSTGELHPHDPALLMTRSTAVPYDPAASSRDLDAFHATFLPDPAVVDFLYRAVGSALWAGNRSRVLIIIIGNTTSGKGQWTGALTAALGDLAVPINSSVFRGTLGDAPRPDLLRALQARLVLAEEASRSWDLHTDQVKRMTGGDRIVARKMRSDAMVERVPDFTPLIATNEVPHVKGADAAVRQRLLAFPFDRSLDPGSVDPEIKPRFIRDEGVQRAVLARLVAGCLGTRRVSITDAPLPVAERTQRAFAELDDVEEFLQAMRDEERLLEYDPFTLPANRCVKTSELHAAYVSWVAQHGAAEDRRNRLGVKAFSQRLEGAGWMKIRSSGMRWAGKQLLTGLEQYLT